MIPSTRNAANSSYNYMPRIAIVSQEHYLQVVTATYSSTADLATLIPELPYYEELLTADDYDFSPVLYPILFTVRDVKYYL